jgi:hypothetical protein
VGVGSGAIRAGEAFVQFTLKDGQLRKELAKLEKRFNSIGSVVKWTGAGIAAIGGSVKTVFNGAATVFAKTGGELFDMSKRTTMSVETLSALDYAAQQSGTSLEMVEAAARSLQKKGIDPNKFAEVAAKIAAIEDPVKRAQASFETFGKKAGPALFPMLGEIAQLTDEAKRLGIVMSSEDAQAADELGKSFDTAWDQVTSLTQALGAAVAGPLTALIRQTQTVFKAAIDWANANRPLIQTIAAIGTVVFVAGTAIAGIGIAMQAAGYAIGVLSTAIGAVGSIVAFLMTPLGMVTGVIVAAVAAFATLTETGRAMVASLGGYFSALGEIVVQTFGAVSQALAAGDIEAAGAVLWAALNLLWLQGTQGIRETWHSMTAFLANVWLAFTSGIADLWSKVWAGMVAIGVVIWGNIERGWSHTAEFFSSLWSHTAEWFSSAWDTATALVVNAFDWLADQLEKVWTRIVGFIEVAYYKIREWTVDIGGDWGFMIDRIEQRTVEVTNDIDTKGAQRRADRTNGVAQRSKDREAAAKAQREATAAAALREREQSRKTEQGALDNVGGELQDKLKERAAALAANQDAVNEDQQAKIDAAKKRLDEARGTFNTARDKANGLEAPAAAEGAKGATALSTDNQKLTSAGSFNALAAVLSGQAGNTNEKILDTNKQQLAELQKLNRKTGVSTLKAVS